MSMMLDLHSVPGFLRSRGLSTAADERWDVKQLTGGVSGVVFSADDSLARFVVKQSLDKLAVADDWSAPRERILTEARVLELIESVAPGAGPALLDVDDQSLTITMEHAPDGWGDWKSELLTDVVDVPLARNLGVALGRIHDRTTDGEWSLPPDDGIGGFLALRLEPFHYTVAERLPTLADAIGEVAERIRSRRVCLVHGDFSPKNILVGPQRGPERSFWIIDDEVGHRGDPTFDIAFFLSHLAMKKVRVSGRSVAGQLSAAGAAFVEGYSSILSAPDPEDLAQQIGCLLLARVVGRSRVSYLDDEQKQITLRLGQELLLRPNRFDLSDPISTQTK